MQDAWYVVCDTRVLECLSARVLEDGVGEEERELGLIASGVAGSHFAEASGSSSLSRSLLGSRHPTITRTRTREYSGPGPNPSVHAPVRVVFGDVSPAISFFLFPFFFTAFDTSISSFYSHCEPLLPTALHFRWNFLAPTAGHTLLLSSNCIDQDSGDLAAVLARRRHGRRSGNQAGSAEASKRTRYQTLSVPVPSLRP